MDKIRIQGHSLIAFTNVLFAFNLVISKSLLPGFISPMGLTLSRTLFAAIAFWLTSLFTTKEKVEKKDLLLLFLCGMFGIAINQATFIVGLSATSSVDTSILVTSTPMFVMVLAFFFLGEPITWKKTGGVVVGAAGAILLVLSSHNATQASGSTFGNLMVLLSGLSYSIYLVVVKPLTFKYSSVTLMKWMFLFSAVVLLPLDYNELIHAPAYTAPFQSTVLLKIFYILFVATFITYLMIPMALKRIRPTTVSMYNYLQPVIATLIACVIGHDTISWQKVGAAILIFFGVYLVTISKSRAELDKEKEVETEEEEEEDTGIPEVQPVQDPKQVINR